MSPRMILAALGAAAVATVASAQVVEPGNYELRNHPDGAARSPYYGLRLDGLFTGDTNHIYTFDFEAPGSNMRMTITEAAGDLSVRIFGTAWGGRDVGSSYAGGSHPDAHRTGLYSIDFTYRENVVIDANGLRVTGDHSSNNGSITAPTGQVFGMVDEQGSHDYSFQVANGHRGHPGLSGWGWVNHSGGNHIYDSDWLFTAIQVPNVQIPLPGAAGLAATGLGCVAIRRRR